MRIVAAQFADEKCYLSLQLDFGRSVHDHSAQRQHLMNICHQWQSRDARNAFVGVCVCLCLCVPKLVVRVYECFSERMLVWHSLELRPKILRSLSLSQFIHIYLSVFHSFEHPIVLAYKRIGRQTHKRTQHSPEISTKTGTELGAPRLLRSIGSGIHNIAYPSMHGNSCVACACAVHKTRLNEYGACDEYYVSVQTRLF